LMLSGRLMQMCSAWRSERVSGSRRIGKRLRIANCVVRSPPFLQS
jgi:hypothetical protein